MLKKIGIVVLTCSSSFVFAGTMGASCSPTNATTPCVNSGWGVGAQALYLKPTYDNALAYIGTNSISNNAQLIANNPDWSWGFKLEGLYKFNTGNDLNLNWYHLADQTTQTHAFNEIALIERGGLFTDTVSISPRWDAVNLEMGQHVDFGLMTSIRFHGGVQYANIQTKKIGFPVAADLDPTISRNESLRFSGVGPRVGLDMSHNFSNGFSLYAQSATSLLTGRNKYNGVVQGLDGGGATGQPIFRVLPTSASKTIIAPELEAKLGLTYSYTISQNNLLFDVGYMWINYFNTQSINTPFNSSNASFTNANFALNGPYAGIKWVGASV